jgi:hypothetical protein
MFLNRSQYILKIGLKADEILPLRPAGSLRSNHRNFKCYSNLRYGLHLWVQVRNLKLIQSGLVKNVIPRDSLPTILCKSIFFRVCETLFFSVSFRSVSQTFRFVPFRFTTLQKKIVPFRSVSQFFSFRFVSFQTKITCQFSVSGKITFHYFVSPGLFISLPFLH